MKQVAIVGASGYSGEELVRLLLSHPHAELTAVTSRQYAGQTLAQVFPKFAHHPRARALLTMDANLRPLLKAEGLLTRDPRQKERKKYGQPGARKRYQYSKR